jgi:hypothetical protein
MTASWCLPLLIRAIATALIVVAASAAAETLGPLWGAVIASLPVSAGPAYVFLALQHGPDFLAASALGSLVANASTGLFLVCYGRLAARVPAWRSLGAAILAWLAASLATRGVAWTPLTALLLNLAVYGGGLAVLESSQGGPAATGAAPRRRWFDLPLRAAAVAAFVSLVVAASAVLGPQATGIAAVFPISLISLLVILRPRIGGAAAFLLAANALRAMAGFGLMLLVLHLAIRPWGVGPAMSAALCVSVGWSIGLLLLRCAPRPGALIPADEETDRCVVAGEGRPPTTIPLTPRQFVGGRARPGHDT